MKTYHESRETAAITIPPLLSLVLRALFSSADAVGVEVGLEVVEVAVDDGQL